MGLPGSRLLLSGVYNFVFYCIFFRGLDIIGAGKSKALDIIRVSEILG